MAKPTATRIGLREIAGGSVASLKEWTSPRFNLSIDRKPDLQRIGFLGVVCPVPSPQNSNRLLSVQVIGSAIR